MRKCRDVRVDPGVCTPFCATFWTRDRERRSADMPQIPTEIVGLERALLLRCRSCNVGRGTDKGDNRMYAVFTEVNADESQIEAGREFLPQRAAPMAPRNAVQKAAIGLPLRMVVASPWWFSRPKRRAPHGSRDVPCRRASDAGCSRGCHRQDGRGTRGTRRGVTTPALLSGVGDRLGQAQRRGPRGVSLTLAPRRGPRGRPRSGMAKLIYVANVLLLRRLHRGRARQASKSTEAHRRGLHLHHRPCASRRYLALWTAPVRDDGRLGDRT